MLKTKEVISWGIKRYEKVVAFCRHHQIGGPMNVGTVLAYFVSHDRKGESNQCRCQADFFHWETSLAGNEQIAIRYVTS